MWREPDRSKQDERRKHGVLAAGSAVETSSSSSGGGGGGGGAARDWVRVSEEAFRQRFVFVRSEYLVNIVNVGGPLSSGGPDGDGEGLSLVTYWPNK